MQAAKGSEKYLGNGLMEVKRTSSFTGREHLRLIAIVPEQLMAWRHGKPIQEAMPNISPDDREFLMTGATPEEWNEFVKDADD